MGRGVKISQATLKTPYDKSKLNILMAPISSGKTYYFGGKFVEHIAMPENKLVIFLAPLRAIVAQAHASERMEELTSESEDLLRGFTIFTDNEPITPAELTGRKIAMTAQKFIPLIKNHPEIIQQIGAVVLDEFDSILSSYAPQDRAKNSKYGLHLLLPSLSNLAKMGVYTVLTSATISDYANKELSKFPTKEIFFHEPLAELSPKSIQYFSDKSQIQKSNRKTAVYMARVSSLLQLKRQLEAQNYKVALLKSQSKSNDVYDMDEYDLFTLKSITENGCVPDNLDFLLFNKAYERGVSITAEQFDQIFVWDINSIVQLQAAGRFRYDGMDWIFKAENGEENVKLTEPENNSSKDTNIIQQYLDKELDSGMKKELAKQLNWRASNKKIMGWNNLKEELIKQGYVIQESRKNNKRVSVIKKAE